MSKSPIVGGSQGAWLRLAATIAVATVASCNVYDADLLPAPDARPRLNSAQRETADASLPMTSADASLLATGIGDTPSALSERCGDGIVDEGEQCDVAIASGRPGACPEGCSGHKQCARFVLEGTDCSAHCVETRVTEAGPADDCCPQGASAAMDSDCRAVCGNGLVEATETCDPPETCAKASACTARDSCEVATYQGDPERCTASCEVRSIRACVSADGCCPAGCSHAQDSDCVDPTGAGCSGPDCGSQVADAGSRVNTSTRADDARADDADAGSPPAPLGADAQCITKHGHGDCEVCDCARCDQQVEDCDAAPGPNASALCRGILACASWSFCSGIDCYCDARDPDRCQLLAQGPCANEIRAAAYGATNLYQVLALGTIIDGPLARAMTALSCRKARCASACGLD